LVRSVAATGANLPFACRWGQPAGGWWQLISRNALLIALAGSRTALLLTKWTAHGFLPFPAPTTRFRLLRWLDARGPNGAKVAAIMISLLTAARLRRFAGASRLPASPLDPVSALRGRGAPATSRRIPQVTGREGLVVRARLRCRCPLLLVCVPDYWPHSLQSTRFYPRGSKCQPHVSCQL